MKPTHVCRCCLSEDCYKDITNEYFHAGQKEIYSDMLYETFNLNITYQEDSTRLICEECIVKLRDATDFRKQVILAEMAITKKVDIDNKNGSNLITKLEVVQPDDFIDHITCLHDIGDVQYKDDDFGWQNDDHVINNDDDGQLFVIKLEPKDEQNTQAEHKSHKTNTKKSTKIRQIQSIVNDDGIDVCDDEKPIGTKNGLKRKAVKFDKEKIKKEDTTKRKKFRTPATQSEINMKQNTLKLIENSNLCLFESLKIKFRCFYCKNSYLNIKELRDHTASHSNPTYLKKCINSMRGMSYKNVEISNLTCKRCLSSQNDLNTLKTHLTEEHRIEFPSDEHLLIPYKLEDGFHCVFCSEQFNTFYRLMLHMNKHYTNHVCEICGVSFINRMSLRTHVQSIHREKKCSVCSAVFQNNYARVKHMRKMHNTKESIRYCLFCDKTFPYTYLLDEHKIREHGMKRPISNCLECGKVFLTPQNLKVHIRSVHIRERNYPCSYCGMRFFTKCDQRRHERTHEDVRLFACSYCEGRFKSKDSLRRHLKRQHRHLFVSDNSETVVSR